MRGSPAARRADALHQAGADGLANLFASIVGGAVTLTMVLLVTHERGPDGAGAFFVAVAVFVILSNVGELGADTGVLRSVPHALADDRHDILVRTLMIALVPPVVVSGLAGLVLVFAASAVGALAGSHSAETAEIIRGLAGFLPFSVLTTVTLAATRGFRDMGPTIWIDRIARPLLQCAGVAVVATHGGLALGVAFGAPHLLTAGMAVVALHRRTGARRRDPHERKQRGAAISDAVLAREFWGFAGPRALSALAAILIEKADVLLVAALASTGAAGVYSATTRLAVVGTIGAGAVSQASQPVVSDLLARRRNREARHIAQAATTWTMLVTWPVCGAMALLAGDIMPVFGGGFGSGRDALVVVAVGMMVAAAVGPSETTLLMSGGSRRALLNTLAALVVNIGANIALIPHYGITGAAVAGALSLLTMNFAAVMQVHSLLGFLPFARSWAFAAAVVTSALVVAFGMASLAADHTTRIAVFALAGAAVYLPLVGVLRSRLELPTWSARGATSTT